VRGAAQEPETRRDTRGTSRHGPTTSATPCGRVVSIRRLGTAGGKTYPGRPACGPVGWSAERAARTGGQASAAGRVGTRSRAEGLNGRAALWPVVESREGLRRGVGQGPASGRTARLAHWEKTLG
jgi:hypothetical protein